MKRLLLLLFFILSSSSFAVEHPIEEGLKIYTYGGGELLVKVFNVVATLFRTETNEYSILIVIALNVGLLTAVILAMNRVSLSPLWRGWLIPAFLTISLFTINSEKVIIYDLLVKTDNTSKVHTVSNVPILLAYTAHFMSSLSYGMTEMLEKVEHLANDETYNWTGHIYAGKSLFNVRKIQIVDGVTRENFHNFCRECVFRDLGLGLYTRKELEEAPNLLKFLEQRTSRIRGVSYRQAHQVQATNRDENKKIEKIPLGKMSMLSCREAISHIRGNLQGQLANSKELLFGAIGSEFNHLLDRSQNAPIQDLIEQQIAIDALKEYTPGRYDTLASRRAQQLQMESQKTLGAMGATSIISLRNYLEAFSYLVFPIVIIISLCSLGFKVFFGWGQLVAWVSFWPPCYVGANFLLETIWDFRMRSSGFFGKPYTLLQSEGIFHIYNQMESIACAVFLSIPVISYGLLYLSKGGISSFMNLASSNHSAQSAASSATSQELDGNYSIKGVNHSNRSLGNTTSFQQNTASTFLGGTISSQDSYAKVSTSLSGTDLSLDERKSNLLSDITSSEGFTNSVQSHLKEARSASETESHTVSENIANTLNSAEGINQHIAKSLHHSQGSESSTLSGAQKMWQEGFNKIEDYGKSHNLDKGQAFDEVIRVGAGGGILLKAGVDASLSNNFRELTSEQQSERIGEAQSLYTHLQELSQTIQREGVGLSGDEGFRGYQDFVESWNKTENSLEQLSFTYANQNSWEEMQSGIESNDLRVSKNLNNDFIKDLMGRTEDMGEVRHILTTPSLREKAIGDFVNRVKPETYIQSPDFSTYNASKLGQEKSSNWATHIEENAKQAKPLMERIQRNNPQDSNFFEGSPYLERMDEMNQETFSGFSHKDITHFKEIRNNAEKLSTNEEGRDGKIGNFLSAEKDWEDKNSTVFLAKAAVASTLYHLAEKTGKFFGFSKSDKEKIDFDKNKQIYLPGWDELKDEQKLAILNERISNLYP